MAKKVLVTLPPGLLEHLDYVAKVEHRNRSDLIREALRRYVENFRRTQNELNNVVTLAERRTPV